MRTIRIYQPGEYTVGETIELSPSASQHVAVVLRLGVNDPITLFCGDNREFSALIALIQKKKVMVLITAVQDVNRESPRSIHLAQAISKGDRMEWVIQKAVELGVSVITPIVTARCAVKLDADRLLKKQAQWQSIAIAACEQSGRNHVPKIQHVSKLDVFLQQCHTTLKLVLHPDTNASWRDYSLAAGDITLLIGPEGGLDEDEVCRAKAHAFQPLCLGPRILRTETAAIAALSVLQAVSGDW